MERRVPGPGIALAHRAADHQHLDVALALAQHERHRRAPRERARHEQHRREADELRAETPRHARDRFPHSEISGSKLV